MSRPPSSVRLLSSVMALIGLACGAASAADRVVVEPGRAAQVWEGAGSCLCTWGQNREQSLGEPFQKIWAEDIGFTVLRVDLSPIVLSGDGRHTYRTVEFDADPAKNQGYFTYGNPANARMGIFAATAKALSRRVPDLKVICTVWTPPHWMKQGAELMYFDNDSAKGTLRSDPKTMEQYGRYMASAVLAFERASGTPVHALSIENEPLFENPFNSMKLSPADYSRALATVASEFARLKMKTLFFGPESVIYGTMPKDTWLIDQQVEYCTRIAADPIAARAVAAYAAHGYGGDGITSDLKSAGNWQYYWDKVKAHGKRSWMTETGGGRPEEALARFPAAIMEGMLQGNVSMWVNWQLSDGGPVTEHTLINNELDTRSLKYNVAKHFFRYIRPGAQRLESTPSIVPGDFSTCIWHHARQKTITVLLYNMAGQRTVSYKLPPGISPSTLRVIQTTEGSPHQVLAPLRVLAGQFTVTVPPMSLTTLTNGS